MARLETQINQIYLTHPELRKNSLILYEEQLTNSLQLFVVAELWNIQKKSESNDLKKISEIILSSFHANKKLPAETLFETSLSTINQNLADLAHEGRKSWVGKFSCLICIKGLDNNIFLANNGQTQALLKRRTELTEILPSEKRGTHPLKTFVNFTQGKLIDNDSLILTTSNVFNYISIELFSKLIGQKPLDEACGEISKILKDSMSADAAFCAFLINFSRKMLEEKIESPQQNIYTPLPEEMPVESNQSNFRFKLPKFSSFSFSFSLPKPELLWLRKIRFSYFQKLSRAGKFFFLSFTLFLILFLANLGIYAAKLRGKKAAVRIDQLVEQINTDLAQTQSALIYKDENQALEKLAETLAHLKELRDLNPLQAAELNPKVEQVRTMINKINTVNEPNLYQELKHNPVYLTETSIGFLMGNEDSNSLSLLSKDNLSDYFLLNSLSRPIRGITYFPPAGVVVATANEIYRIDQDLKQFEPLLSLPVLNIRQIKYANNNLYVLSEGVVTKVTYTRGRYATQTSISGDFTTARDFGVDRDFWLLFPDKIIKFVSGQAQAFPLPDMTDELTNADKILVASNLYVLEANKKRLIILNKNGTLINQIYFPTTSNPYDFYVDEAERNIYLLDDNKLYKITF